MATSRREAFARRLERWGLVRALGRVPSRPRLVVFNYHRIGSTAGNPFDDGIFSATADDFRDQLLFLRDHFRMATLDEVVGSAADGFRFREPTALVTFDDGYRDNFELAFPILSELALQATFFLPTEYMNHPRLPWWDRIAHVVKRAGVGTIALDFPEPATFDLDALGCERVITGILAVYKRWGGGDEDRFFAHLEERARFRVDEAVAARRWNMTWDEARQMAGAGMAFGSHTHTHRVMASLDPAEQLHELRESKRILERELGRPVTTVSFPVGKRESMNRASKAAALEAGYRLAFSFYGGTNQAADLDPFDVRRVEVELVQPMPVFRTRSVLYRAFGRAEAFGKSL